MIPAGAKVYVATRPVDFRKGPDGLAALVRDFGADPFSGALYVFRAKRADRVKIVWWDGSGLCLFAKRLDEDRFRWPRVENGVIDTTGINSFGFGVKSEPDWESLEKATPS